MMKREFGCSQCGHKIEAVPPDDIHTVLSVTKINAKGIETIYDCENCHTETKRYWYKPTSRSVVSRKFSDF